MSEAVRGLLEVHLGEPRWLLALWALPVLAAFMVVGSFRRARALRAFAGGALRTGGSGPVQRQGWAISRALLVLGGFALIAIALARPQRNPQEEHVTVEGRDVVFLIDVSRSMLAQDVVPSRLERAKLWINDLTSGLKGDRVGLVAFAGAAVVKSPLTLDYGFFRMALDELSPQSVSRGGTLIGDAIRKTLTDVFDGTTGRHRDIILITDGEDHESFPQQAAQQAEKMGVRIIAIGIGSDTKGSPVPQEKQPGTFVTQGGEQVLSRLDTATLAQVAASSKGGVFLNVGTGTMDLESVYNDLIAGAEKSQVGVMSSVRYEELFQLALAAAAALLMVEALIRGR